MKGKWQVALPYILMLIAALSRWPGLFPPNFSVFYALAFCAGAFFPRTIRWWLPMGTLVVTDLALNLYYWLALGINAFNAMQLMTYAGFAGLIWFGTKFNSRSSFLSLLGGGILGAVLFYLVTNAAAWLFNPFGNPEYVKDLLGLLKALTTGTHGYPPTFEFFRNTLLSGGLFTGIFVAALKLSAPAESAREKEESSEEEPEEAPGTPEEAKP
jgi:hypothetical protein